MTRTPAILYATDFSPASIAAFRAAVEEARRRRTELLVAHVAAIPIRAIEGGLRRGRRYDALLEPAASSVRRATAAFEPGRSCFRASRSRRSLLPRAVTGRSSWCSARTGGRACRD